MVDAPSSRDGPRIDVDDSEGRLALWLSTADVRVGVVPALGVGCCRWSRRRASTYFATPTWFDQALHRVGKVAEGGDDAAGTLGSWANWGGDKTWPAPQGWSGPGEWPGPPDPGPGRRPYTARWATGTNQASIEMRSADDARSGLRIDRKVEVTAGKSGYRLTSTFTNVERSGGPLGYLARGAVAGGPARLSREERRPGTAFGWAPDRCRARPSGTSLPGRAAYIPTRARWGGLGAAPGRRGQARLRRCRGLGSPRRSRTGNGSEVRPRSGRTLPRRRVEGGSVARVPLRGPLAELGGLWPRHRVVECEVPGLPDHDAWVSTQSGHRCARLLLAKGR